MKPVTRKYLRSTHKWVGLIGGAWLIVLGLTGLMLDHRDDWGWAWRLAVPDTVIPSATVEKLLSRHVTLAQADPENSQNWIVGGPNGLWVSRDGAHEWIAVEFEGRKSAPMVTAIVQDQALAWNLLWLATDTGLWSLDSSVQSPVAIPAAFEGRHITALDNGSRPDELVLVIDRSDMYSWSPGTPAVQIALDSASVSGLPEQLSWSRFVFDLHLGRALLDRPASRLINDFGALAFILLPLSGFLAWYLPKRWRGRRGPAPTRRTQVFKLIYRVHAPLLGLLALIPLLYLSVTGIVMDHRDELVRPLARNSVARDALPPVYQFSSLDEEISHVVAYPGKPGKYTVGTRLGVLTSSDHGLNWTRETGVPASPGFVWSLKRFGDNLFLGGLGGPSFERPLDGNQWSMVPGLVGMPSDATVSDKTWYVISGPTMLVGDLETGFSAQPFSLPVTNSKPLMLLMFELHNGKIIHPAIRWVLDVLAILTILMVITGPILWWRRKW